MTNPSQSEQLSSPAHGFFDRQLTGGHWVTGRCSLQRVMRAVASRHVARPLPSALSDSTLLLRGTSLDGCHELEVCLLIAAYVSIFLI